MEQLSERAEAQQRKPPPSPADARFFAAWKISWRYQREYYVGRGSLWGVSTWSRRLAEADIARSRKAEERAAAAQAHLRRMSELRDEVAERAASGQVPAQDYLAAENYQAEAELLAAGMLATPAARRPPWRPGITRLTTAQLVYDVYLNKIQEARRGADPILPPERAIAMMPLGRAIFWSGRWRDAQMDLDTDPAARRTAAQAYLKRQKELEEFAQSAVQSGKRPRVDLDEATFHRAEAEILLHSIDQIKPALETARVRLDAAKAVCEHLQDQFQQGRCATETLGEWSAHWRDAALALATTPAERMAAVQADLTRLREAHRVMAESVRAGRSPTYEQWNAEYYLALAELILARERSAPGK
jgi:hypothetical protein